MPDQVAIAIHEATFRYGQEAALQQINFTVKPGEMFGLVGPDGAGKTTLIRVLTGLLDLQTGTCTVLGFNSKHEKRQINSRIGYLSQRYSLYGDLTVEENIDFFAEIHQVRGYKERKAELLEFTRLTPFIKRLSERLSGGMKQKLALACTLIHTPSVLFLDEPTTGVDPVSRREFWSILNDLLATGLTIVMSTPYLDEAERCTRVALINRGTLLACDTPNNIRKLMQDTFLELHCSLLRQAAALSAAIAGVTGVQMFGEKLHIGFDGTLVDQETIVAALERQGIKVARRRLISPSLEDVFIKLVSSKD